VSKKNVQQTAIQLMILFFIFYLALNAAATLFYFLQGFEAFGPPTKNDSVHYHNQAVLIAQSGNFSLAILPYEYLVGLIYIIFGTEIGPYAFKIILSLVGSSNIYLIISIIGAICIYRNFSRRVFHRWAKIASVMMVLYPTYTMYSINMVRDLFLVNGVLLFVFAFIGLFILRTNKWTYYFMFLFSILFVFILRPYFGVLITLTVLIFMITERKYRTKKNLAALTILTIIVGTLLSLTKYGFFGVNYIFNLASLNSLSSYRSASSVGNLILGIEIDFMNPFQFIVNYSYAFLINHIYPFPNYLNGITNLLFLPENLTILFMLISILKRVRYKMREYKEYKFLLIYYFLNIGLIVAFSDNIGTNIRLRMASVICLFILYFISLQINKQSKLNEV